MLKKGSVQFEVIVGTYEEFVLGYQYHLDEETSLGELSQAFATHSHRASVRAVACHGKLVVSGGADETINIYNMFTRKECGMLMEHNGTITSLNFTPDCSHVISTSEDGSIKIFRQGSWQLEKVWPNAHKGTAVACLSVHPSGKMALSVGKDHTLRTWNLVKGRPAYTTNLYSRCRQLELVTWSPGGQLFAIPMDTKVEITSTQKAGVLHTLELPTKVTACSFLTEYVICIGEASGVVTAFNMQTAALLWSLPGQERVRGLAAMHNHLVTATSNGRICVYALPDSSTPPHLVTATDCGCRITCLTLYDYKSEIKVKKEKAEDENEKVPKAMKNNKEKRRPSQLEEINENESHKTKKKKSNKSYMEDTSVAEEPETKEVNTITTNVINDKRNSTQWKETGLDRLGKKEKRKMNSSEFEETNKTKTANTPGSLKKNKSIGSHTVVCSPRTQKWMVEDKKG